MAQLFKPSANSVARMSIMATGLAVVLIFGLGMTLSRGSLNTRVGLAPDQPVPFSHQHHATELGIDCRYCHTTVEKSAAAGMPGTETCMSCHSQIWTNSPLLDPVRQSQVQNRPLRWVKLNKVPEFVYFNHAVHVNKGVSCNTCHGPVQTMQMAYKARSLFMSWCLECHQSPEKYMFDGTEGLSPREQVFDLYKKYQLDPSLAGSSPVEQKLARGDEQRVPKDLEARGVELMRLRGLKKAQMTDCYTCHR